MRILLRQKSRTFTPGILTVECGELAHPVGSHETPRASLDTCIPVCGVCGVQLVLVADPGEAGDVEDGVEELEVEVARDAEDGGYAELVDSGEGSVGRGDGESGKVPRPHVVAEGDLFGHFGGALRAEMGVV